MPKIDMEVQLTPNPNALKVTVSKPTTSGPPVTFSSAEEAAGDATARALFAVPGVVRVFMTANFISITKTDDVEWETIVPEIRTAISSGLADG
jgi:hypothetical protein